MNESIHYEDNSFGIYTLHLIIITTATAAKTTAMGIGTKSNNNATIKAIHQRGFRQSSTTNSKKPATTNCQQNTSARNKKKQASPSICALREDDDDDDEE